MDGRPMRGRARRWATGALALLALLVSLSYSRAELAAQAAPQTTVTAQEVAIVQALTALLSDTSSVVRSEAARALGERAVAARAAVPALINALGDPQRRVRVNAASALGEIGDPAAITRLGDVMTADAGREVSVAAANAL